MASTLRVVSRRLGSVSRVIDVYKRQVQELGGHGVTAKVDGRTVAAGNARLMEKLGLKAPAVSGTGTIVHVAIEGMYAGYLLIADVVKPHSAQAIRGLKDAGVRKTVMLTGDAEPVAKAVSAELGLDEYHAGLLPGDKVDQIETLLAAKRPKENLAIVGDGKMCIRDRVSISSSFAQSSGEKRSRARSTTVCR